MGLAEPRKRTKISNDPRNTTWTTSSDSYGQRLMQRQGWKTGEALGANGTGSNYADAEAAKVSVKYKDDMLGLGATLKSKDIANQRTGFDAFQGLLGRLNAKSEEEVQAVEKKLEDKKLAMFAQGRWGGMIFVPGGILVQRDPFKEAEAQKKIEEEDNIPSDQNENKVASPNSAKAKLEEIDQKAEKAERKAEKKRRKEEKRLDKEAKLAERQTGSREAGADARNGLPTPESSSGNEDKAKKQKEKKKKKRQRSENSDEEVKPEVKPVAPPRPVQRNGRHLLRGKNIQAKRMAFSDMKGLDEIFMRAG